MLKIQIFASLYLLGIALNFALVGCDSSTIAGKQDANLATDFKAEGDQNLKIDLLQDTSTLNDQALDLNSVDRSNDGHQLSDQSTTIDSSPDILLADTQTPDQGCITPPCLESATVKIYVSNSCVMQVVPTQIEVPPNTKMKISYHNMSDDYPVDIWMSYNGGFLDLPTHDIWNEKYEWCGYAGHYDGYADISTACSKYRLNIICLD